MAILQGNISGSISSIPFNIPCKIISAYLTNRSIGSIDINVYVATETGDRSIVPLNKTLLSGAIYILDVPIILLAGYYLIVVSNGSLDYYFSYE